MSRLSVTVSSIVAGAALWLASAGIAGAAVSVDASSYVLVSSSRVDRDQFDYHYSVVAHNSGTTVENNCVGEVASSSPATVVRDAFLSFPTLPAGASATSTDTFTIRQNRTVAFNPNHLSWQVQCTNTPNTPPSADAGADQTVFNGSTVTLDGSGSTDVDGDPLTFQWSLVAVPSGSTAVLSSATDVMPTFVADVDGQYDVQLIVNDGKSDSVPDLVVISTIPQNIPPVANAGADHNAFVGSLVTLDGTASSDVNGDPLTFSWAIVGAPSGSAAVLTGGDTPQPSFVPDDAGDYTVRLTVSDPHGATDTDDVVVSTQQPNLRPVAEAGQPLTTLAGRIVQLEGAASFDPEGTTLLFGWSFVTRPAGSTATLSNPAVSNPTFFADRAGVYVVQLSVSDGQLLSVPDTVLITSNNAPPVAQAGPDQMVLVGSDAHLIGSASTDANNDPLAFFWSFTAQPPGGTTVLNGALTPVATFTPDRVGLYVAQLIVNDGTVDSAPDTVNITVDHLPAISMPATLNVPFRGTRTVPITITRDLANMGDVVLSLTSSNPSVIAVSTPPVTIPAGQSSATFALFGESLGSAVLTATAAGFPSVTANGSSAASLNFTSTGRFLIVGGPPLSVPLYFETPPGTSAPAPAGGIPVALVAANPACVSVPPSHIIPSGISSVAVSMTYGGTALLPCSTAVTASGPTGIASDSMVITVLPTESLFVGIPPAIGSGFQIETATVTLSTPNHGGVTVRLESADPTRVLIAPDAATPGSGFVDVFVPNGSSSATYVIQGADWAAGASVEGPVNVTASAVGFAPWTQAVHFQQGRLALLQFGGSENGLTPVSRNLSFFVVAGAPSGGGGVVSQRVRAGSSLTVTVTNSNAAVAEIDPTGGGSGSQSFTVTIPGGQPGSVAVSGLEWDPVGAGTTTLTAASPGFVSTPEGNRTYVVQASTLNIPGITTPIGAGLQVRPLVMLSGPNHGGVTVRIESSDPSRVRVTTNPAHAGLPFEDVWVADGVAEVRFLVKAVRWTEGISTPAPVTITASAAGFVSDAKTYNYVQAGVMLFELPASTTLLSPNSDFVALVGFPQGNGVKPQEVASGAGWGEFIATISNSDASVAQLDGDGGGPGMQQRSVRIFPFGSTSDYFDEGVEFDPTGTGTTSVSVTIPGFVSMPLATRDVSVTHANGPAPLGLTFVNEVLPEGVPTIDGIGAGLQTEAFVDLPHGQHGGTMVTVASSDPSRVLIAPDLTSAGSGSLTFQLPNGSSSVEFVVRGVAWTEGSSSAAAVTVTASTAFSGFTNATATLEYEQAALGILGLPGTAGFPDVNSTSANVDFQVGVGLVDLVGGRFQPQKVNPGAGLVVTLANSNAGVAEIDLNGGAAGAQTRTVTIPAGQISTPFNGPGGVEFDPLGAGSTIVSANSPGFSTHFGVSTHIVTVLP